MSTMIPNPPNATTEVDVRLLPRWVAISYVARCVRRVFRLFQAVAPAHAEYVLDCYSRTISVTEQSAARGEPVADLGELATQALQRAHQHEELRSRNPRPLTLDERLTPFVGDAAANVALACVKPDAEFLEEAYTNALAAAQLAQSRVALQGMQDDWNYLRTQAAANQWTDETTFTPEQVPTPTLRITGLYIKNLRAIKQLRWPQDGLGWGARVPDIVMLSSANGGGKTTLLEFVYEAFRRLWAYTATSFIPKSLDAEEAWIEFEIDYHLELPTRIRFLVGSPAFVQQNAGAEYWAITRNPDGRMASSYARRLQEIFTKEAFAQTTLPSVVFIPSEERTLIVPPETYKSAGANVSELEFTFRWQPPKEWKDTLEAVLYAMRWQDLNAREEGRVDDTNNFEAYAAAFRQFSGHTKELTWRNGLLVVRLQDGTTHDLNELSSGEKQVLLLSGELLRRWRPGSLVMIDEPELHLHGLWQIKLYHALRYWLAERGGQLLLATHSDNLFYAAEPKSIALLGGA